MKFNKKFIAPLVTIAAFGALAVGSTYALFTSNDQSNIAVNSGKVEVTSELANLKTYSGIDLVGDPTLDTEWTDDLGGDFSNGGSAQITDGSLLTLDKLSPGDKVIFDLKAENKSNIAIKWRYSYQVIADNGLANALKISVDNVVTQVTTMRKNSNWIYVSAPTSKTHELTVELPSNKGNEYQNKTCSIKFFVEAVQGNAYTEDINYEVACEEDLISIRNNTNNGTNYSGEIIGLMSDLDLSGMVWTPIGNSESNAFAGSFNGLDHTIKNLYIDNPSAEGTGLFGYVSNPTETVEFKNVKLEDAVIDLDVATEGKNVGAFIGYILKSSKEIVIDNVDVIGNSSVSSKSHAGGIVGKIYAENATVKNCENNASVTCGSMYAGGIVGIASNTDQTIIFDSLTNNGSVSGSIGGGIVGRTGSLKVDFISCQNNGNVNCSSITGGLVGTGEGTISANFDSDSNSSGLLSGSTKGILIGYIYKYTSPSCDIVILRNGTTEYADTIDNALIGKFAVCTLTISSAKVHSLSLESSWKNVCVINFDNCIVDELNWETSSGMYPTSHADDGEYLYVNGNNNSSVGVLNYYQSQSFYTNYYSFKDVSISINNPSSAPLVEVAWIE